MAGKCQPPNIRSFQPTLSNIFYSPVTLMPRTPKAPPPRTRPPACTVKINADNGLHRIDDLVVDARRPWYQYDYIDPAHKFVTRKARRTYTKDVKARKKDRISDDPVVGPPLIIPSSR